MQAAIKEEEKKEKNGRMVVVAKAMKEWEKMAKSLIEEA